MTQLPTPAQDPDAWIMDNPPSKKWPLYTRGNVGEVFPEVVLPLSWDAYGQEAEDGWRDGYRDLGLLVEGDFDDDEPMIILGVFGGYAYINASYVRMLGLRAPGGSIDVIDMQFFGESDAPSYVSRKGDKNLKSSALLGKTVFKLLGTKNLPELEDDKAAVQAFIKSYPGQNATDDQLLGHLLDLKPLFRRLFARHIGNTMGAALMSGALNDLLVKVDMADQLVSLLGGIGDVESAAPSSAMWKLAHSEHDPESEEWQADFGAFLDEFGSRGPNEWDLGSDPWEFRPELALAAIDRMRGADASHAPHTQAMRLASERTTAVSKARHKLNFLDKRMFDKALRATSVYSQGRERSKTTIVAAIQSGRRAARELGRRAAERGGPSDIIACCLLTLDELSDFMKAPAQWEQTLTQRRELHERLSGLIPPFIFEGEIPPIDTWESRSSTADSVIVGQKLQGIAGCPGFAQGRAVVVTDPADPRDLGPGDVLVAPITDPSWTPLFLAAEAVVVDVGATMSHAVIVSRELGIPCVVSTVGATRTIPDGAKITVDGNTGEVTVIELP